MKKISLLLSIAIAAVTLVSCNNQKYEAQAVDLNSESDSLNFTLGIVNGAQIKIMNFADDDSNTPVAEFIDALDKCYNSTEDISKYELLGIQLGSSFKEQAKTGIMSIKSWKYDHQIACQAFINSLLNYKGNVDFDYQQFFQEKYTAAMQQPEPEDVAVAKIKGKCPSTAADVDLKTELDSINYALGYFNGNMIISQFGEFDTDSLDFFVAKFNEAVKSDCKYPSLVVIATNIANLLKNDVGLLSDSTIPIKYDLIRQGFINGMKEDTVFITAEEANEYVKQTVNTIRLRASEPNRIAGEEFLAENGKRPEVKTTESGLQYEVLTRGKGKVHPAATDTVTVHYHGTLIDGTVFDSSVERGVPASFPLNGVIRGWTEGVQLMVVGDKFRFFIPYHLAYGEQDTGKIKPYSTLVFDVELLGINEKK